MGVKSFILYDDSAPAFEILSDESAGRLIKAIFACRRKEKVQVPAEVAPLFAMLQAQIARDNEKHRETCARNRENVLMRWKKQHTTVYDGIRPNTNHTDSDNDSDNENEKKEKNKENGFSLSAAPSGAESVFPFNAFWEAYGKKIDRKKCQTKYSRISEPDRAAIKAKLPAYLAATPELQYRKAPLRWLTGECWLDESVPAPHADQPQQSRAEREMAELEAFTRSQRP